MRRNHSFNLSAVAAAIALAMGSTCAMATTNQLPGQGAVVAGAVSVGTLDTAGGRMSLNVSGPAVINWGRGGASSDINPGGVPGFNIGSGASVNFNGSAGAAVLNIDSSGNASRIFGTLSASGTKVFVANANGILIGARARIVSDSRIDLIANKRFSGTVAGFDGSDRSIAFDGRGGDVTVRAGASFSGRGTVLVSGGNTVNVDLGAFASRVTLRAGLPSAAAGAQGTSNPNASLAVSGQQRAAIGGFGSAGNALNSGTLTLARASVAGTFDNTGKLTLDGGFSMGGRLLNEQTLVANGPATFGSLTNDGSIAGPSYRSTLSVNRGNLTNNGAISGVSYIGVSAGNLTNGGTIALVDRSDAAGQPGTLYVDGGNLINQGRITSVVNASGAARYADLSAFVLNGSIANSGRLADFASISTGSDASDATFTAGADYSISNTGSIAGDFSIDANAYSRDDNNSTGSFTSTGVLNVRGSSGRYLSVSAHDNLDLGGSVRSGGKALSSSNALDSVDLAATNGLLTVDTPLTFYADGVNAGAAYLSGRRIRLQANVVGTGGDSGIYVTVGSNASGGYALRIDDGVQLSAGSVRVNGKAFNP